VSARRPATLRSPPDVLHVTLGSQGVLCGAAVVGSCAAVRPRNKRRGAMSSGAGWSGAAVGRVSDGQAAGGQRGGGAAAATATTSGVAGAP
jgi:hypothetical protein